MNAVQQQHLNILQIHFPITTISTFYSWNIEGRRLTQSHKRPTKLWGRDSGRHKLWICNRCLLCSPESMKPRWTPTYCVLSLSFPGFVCSLFSSRLSSEKVADTGQMLPFSVPAELLLPHLKQSCSSSYEWRCTDTFCALEGVSVCATTCVLRKENSHSTCSALHLHIWLKWFCACLPI